MTEPDSQWLVPSAGEIVRYEKAVNQVDRYATFDWGAFTRYLEIADDGYTYRQVDIYSNGHVLRYDRTCWIDQFGKPGEARHPLGFDAVNSHRWAVMEIESAELESAWSAAQHAPNQPQRYDASGWAGVAESLAHGTQEQRRRMPP